MDRRPSPRPAGPRLAAGIGEARQSVFAALQGRIATHRARGGELIPLHIGDTYLPPPEGTLAPIDDPREVSVYGPIGGLPALQQALAERLAARGLKLARSRDNVLVGSGCTHALFCAVRALLDPGDDVLVLSPYWPLIAGVLETAGARPIEVPLSFRLYAEPELDIRAVLEAARTERTRALYLITPNNPDGQVYTAAQLEAMAAFARTHDLWVLSDEVYADHVYAGEHVSIANLAGMAERTVTSHSLSKSHALAGARIGYVAASERVIAAARRVSNHTVYNIPVPMQNMALRAIAAGEVWLADARKRYREARDRSSEVLARAGIAHHVPPGGTFFFLDLRDRLGDRPVSLLFEQAIDAGVLVAPGRAFGEGFDAYARLCFTGAPLETVLEGLERFAEVLASLSSGEATKRSRP